jgi:hypothetical protein
MMSKNIPVFDVLLGILKALWLFLACLAPLMFLVGVISTLDQWGTRNRFLENLAAYGKTAQATVNYIDDEWNYAGLSLVDSTGYERFARLDFRYYPKEVVAAIREGDTLTVIYIDALISEGEKAALAEYDGDIKATPAIPAEYWWLLGISWLVVAVQPQFVFLGIEKFDLVMELQSVIQPKGA